MSLFEFTNLASVSGALLGEPAGELLGGSGLRPVEDDHPTVRRLHLVHEAPVTGHSQIISLGLQLSVLYKLSIKRDMTKSALRQGFSATNIHFVHLKGIV